MIGFLRQDSDLSWYLVPSVMAFDFDEFKEKLKKLKYKDNPELFDEFEEVFGKYRIDNPYRVKCIIDHEYY